jgi:hypothetical protein
MGHGVKEGDMSCQIVVLKNEIIADNVVQWSVPFEMSKVILILNQQSCERGCKGFGSASSLEKCMWSEFHVRQSGISIALAVSIRWNYVFRPGT